MTAMPVEAYVPARPRMTEEITKLPTRPEVLAAAIRLGVQRVVHFTTLTGTVGILATRALKSRARLPEEKYLEHVYKPNAPFRKDNDWLDYVNLSVERVNDRMLNSSRSWHPADENFWVVLSFAPEVLTHPGVVFTTTNNIYPKCTRAEGLAGFERMFADTVVGRYGRLHNRDGKQAAWTTDRQAEVLYTGELSCKHLLGIDVQTSDAFESIHGALGSFELEGVKVCLAPEVFK